MNASYDEILKRIANGERPTFEEMRDALAARLTDLNALARRVTDGGTTRLELPGGPDPNNGEPYWNGRRWVAAGCHEETDAEYRARITSARREIRHMLNCSATYGGGDCTCGGVPD